MEVFNRALALERLDRDAGKLEDLLLAFKKNVPYLLGDLEAAWKKRGFDRLESLAIELRESVHRIGAEGMEDLSTQLVAAARRSDFDQAELLLTHLGMELDWLLRILDENRCSGNL